MGTTSVTQPPQAMDLGKPQRRYYVEPDETPVPQPSRRDEPAPAPQPTPATTPQEEHV